MSETQKRPTRPRRDHIHWGVIAALTALLGAMWALVVADRSLKWGFT